MLPPLVLSSLECFALRADKFNGQCLQMQYQVQGDAAAGGGRIAANATPNPSGNARARFFAEPSEDVEHLVHIRCCFNNKYWTPTEVPQGVYICAGDEPNEDMSSPSCTLFGISTHEINGVMNVGFRTACSRYKSEIYVNTVSSSGELGLTSEIKGSTFRLFGLWRRNELPKYVAFKGDNGKYLRYSHTWLRFDSNNILDPAVIFIVHTNADGTVSIQSTMNDGAYWRLRRDYGKLLWVAADYTYHDDPDMAFKVVSGFGTKTEGDNKGDEAAAEGDNGKTKAEEGFIALQNMGNGRFCTRLDDPKEEGVSYLSASEKSMSRWARFTVVEPVIRREIFDVKFNLDEARIYNNTLVVLDEDERTNRTSSVQTGSFSFTSRKGVATSWDNTVTNMSKEERGASISATFTEIPIVLSAGVTLSSEAASSQVEAGEIDESKKIEDEQHYTVQPGETVTGRFVATQASCDVPYSYKKKIGLSTGEEFVTVHEDGIYTGVNKSTFRITVTKS